MINKLFVYGTLKEGGGLGQSLKHIRTKCMPGQIKAELYNLGWYPGIKLSETAFTSGELHTYPEHAMEEVLKITDRIEGYNEIDPENGLYNRVQVKVWTKMDKPPDIAWTYVYNGDIEHHKKIKSGEWEIK